jgi:hypothetical protein
MARAAAIGNKRRGLRPFGEPRTGRQVLTEDEAIRTALKEMRRGGVDIDRAPQEALDLVIDANLPVEEDTQRYGQGERGGGGDSPCKQQNRTPSDELTPRTLMFLFCSCNIVRQFR